MIFGNGVPSDGNSIWGTVYFSEAETSGKLTHDVGWAGFFWFFGILTTIALMALMVLAILQPKPPRMKFLNYWLIFIMITSVASAPILYWYQVVNVMTCLGMVYSSSGQEKGESGDAEKIDADNNGPLTMFNPFKRYPQLNRFVGGRTECSK